MIRNAVAVLFAVAALLAVDTRAAPAQRGYDLFQQALVKERSDGKLDEAIQLYQRITREHGSDRALVAKALLAMGQCYERLGSVAARQVYDRVLREFADQPEAASVARARRAALGPTGVTLNASHRVLHDVTYLYTANGYDARMDVHVSRAPSVAPVLVYFHGGGWISGTKEASLPQIQPYLARGWTVASVEYRLARSALAPAAVEDARCALRWVLAHAGEYNIDPSRVVLSGHSAGAHLSLMVGMLPVNAGFDRECAAATELHVAAIVNWYGQMDVADLVGGPNAKSYALAWLGSQPNRDVVARRVSPLTWVRSGLPPVITIHGDADPSVPFQHALRLRDALTNAGVPNELVTIPGGGHGSFAPEEEARAYAAIDAFLKKYGVIR